MMENRKIYVVEHFRIAGDGDGLLGIYDDRDDAIAAVEGSEYAKRDLRLNFTSHYAVSYIAGPSETIEISTIITNEWLGVA